LVSHGRAFVLRYAHCVDASPWSLEFKLLSRPLLLESPSHAVPRPGDGVILNGKRYLVRAVDWHPSSPGRKAVIELVEA
jgi:hypothetical protein